MNIDDRTCRRGLNALLVFTFFMVTGFTMVMPLIAVHFVENIGWMAASIGLALAVRQLLQQGLGIVGGTLSDRFGVRNLLCIGVLLRSVGFASLALAVNMPMLMLSMILSAIGGALFEVPYQASIAMLTTTENRPRYYSLSNLVGGVATTGGPLLGVVLLRFDFKLVCLAASFCFFITFIVAFFILPKIEQDKKKESAYAGLRLIKNDKTFLAFTALLMGYWFVAIQINITIPLFVKRLTGDIKYVGLIASLNAGITTIFQYPLIRILERWLHPQKILVIGSTLISLGIGGLCFASNINLLISCVVLFALGGVLTRPTQQTLNATLANHNALGAYLGVSAISLAVGGSLGNVVGGWLVDVSINWNFLALPWLVFMIIGIISSIGLALLKLPNGKKTGKIQNPEKHATIIQEKCVRN